LKLSLSDAALLACETDSEVSTVCKAQIPLGSSRLDSTRSTYRVECVEPCCSNMADDEQAVVLACTSLVVYMLLHTQILFVLSNKIN